MPHCMATYKIRRCSLDLIDLALWLMIGWSEGGMSLSCLLADRLTLALLWSWNLFWM